MFLRKKLKDSLLILLFVLCATGCGPKDYSLQFSDKMVLDYGSNDSPLILIEKIGETEVTREMIKDNRIEIDNFYVECDEVDTNTIGYYDVKYVTNDTDNRMQIIQVGVQDISAPVINLHKQNLTMTMEEYKEFDFSTIMDISDNWKEDNFMVDLQTKKVDGNGNYIVNITAKDIAGNISKETIELTIKEEEKPKEEENEEENSPSQPENPVIEQPVNPYPQEVTPAPAPSPAPVEPEVTPPVVTAPSTQDFLFSSGYTMDNVGSACQSALSSSGRSGSCSPITDNGGIYLGMRLSLY